MTNDPMNAPIFGDAIPADPPRPVRIAFALLLANVAVLAAHRAYTAFEASFPVFLIPMTFAVWFAVSMRAGRNWARTASTVLSGLFIVMMALLIDYGMVDLLVLSVSAGMLIAAMRLIWRSDVNNYFEP